MSAPLSHSHDHDGPQTDEINRLHMLIESQQKNVNGQVDECRQFVTQSMDRILDVLEQRLNDAGSRQVAAPSAA